VPGVQLGGSPKHLLPELHGTRVSGITSGAKGNAPAVATRNRRCRIAIDDNSDRYASDYKTLGTDNPESGCLVCDDDPKCRLFSWVTSHRTCYLKSSTPPRTAASGIASGTK